MKIREQGHMRESYTAETQTLSLTSKMEYHSHWKFAYMFRPSAPMSNFPLLSACHIRFLLVDMNIEVSSTILIFSSETLIHKEQPVEAE